MYLENIKHIWLFFQIFKKKQIFLCNDIVVVEKTIANS